MYSKQRRHDIYSLQRKQDEPKAEVKKAQEEQKSEKDDKFGLYTAVASVAVAALAIGVWFKSK